MKKNADNINSSTVNVTTNHPKLSLDNLTFPRWFFKDVFNQLSVERFL